MKNSFQKNILLFYITRTFFIPFFWLPVLYIYLTENKGLSDVQAGLLLSLQELLLIFLEVPTGVVADKFSRRVSVALGYILSSLPFVFLPFVDSYYIFVVIFASKAVGKAFISGADTSLLYDTLVDAGQESKYKKIITKSKSLMTACVAICIFLGGIMASYSVDLTLILPFPLMLIGAVSVMLMDEPDTSKKGKVLQHHNYLVHSWDALKYIFSVRTLFVSILVFMANDALAVNMKWFYAPIFSDVNINIQLLGGITALLYIMKAVAGLIGAKVMFESSKRNMIVYSFMIAASFIAIAAFYNFAVIVVALFVGLFASEILDSSVEEDIHSKLDSKTRAASMSIVNLSGSVGATVMLWGFTLIKQAGEIRYAVLFLGLIFVCTAVTALFVRNSKDNKTVGEF